MQILPIVHNLEQAGVEFRFVQGTHEVPPPRGYEEFWGPPPHYSFSTCFSIDDLERKGVSQELTQIGDTPEDTVRNLLPPDDVIFGCKDESQEDLDQLNELLDTEGPFDAVLGFSLGACVAATLLEDNIKRCEKRGVPSMLKLGIFLCGVPPYNVQEGRLFLSDVDGEILRVPTVHIIGSLDPLIDLALALYNLCDAESATIFDHGRGHQVVWEKRVVEDLCNVLKASFQEVALSSGP